MRIAFFSPLSPLQTALADHSEGLLPYLAQGADIDLFIDEGYRPTNEAIVKQFNIFVYHDFPRRAADYDLTVYVMGNSPTFHGFMHELLGRYPGVIILHDTQFQHYFLERAVQQGDLLAYQKEMEHAYGKLGRRATALVLAGRMERVQGVYPLVEPIIDGSRGVVVYNDFAYTDLLTRRPRTNVRRLNYHFYLPQGFSTEIDVQALRKQWRVDGSFVLGTFGVFTSPDKRVDVCLRVFKRFLELEPDARYLLVGSHSPHYDVPSMIRSYGLEGSVTLTGWMDGLSFAQLLCVPDVAIHLRYPHLGGTLYTPMRLLGLGQPTILSDIEPLADFLEGCCAKVPPGEYEEDTLLEILRYLAKHESLRCQMGENGREFIHQKHNVSRIAEQHLDFFREVASTPVTPVAHLCLNPWVSQLLGESASILAKWGVSEDEEGVLHTFTEAIDRLSGEGKVAYNPDEVAVVLQQLKREVRNQRLRDEANYSMALAHALAQVQLTSQVNPHQPIAWPHWPKGLAPKLIALLQKMARRLLRWYINPIVEEQNEFNTAVVAAVEILVEENRRRQLDLRMLSARSYTSQEQQAE